MGGAASNQEELATAAQMAVKTITRLADVVKFGASSLGSDQPEAQVSFNSFPAESNQRFQIGSLSSLVKRST